MMMADELLDHAPGKAFIADAGYDSNRFRQAIRERKKRAVIGSKPERPRKLPKSRDLYAKRYLIECFFPEQSYNFSGQVGDVPNSKHGYDFGLMVHQGVLAGTSSSYPTFVVDYWVENAQ